MSYHVEHGIGGRAKIVRDADAAFIPQDAANRDYLDYLAWAAINGPLDLTPLSQRRPRLFVDIWADLVALTGAQKTAVWTAFTAGSPPLYQTDRGPNVGVLALGQFLGQVASFSAADQLEFKIRAVALYVLDNPTWLVHPSFDASINVPGDEVVP